MKVCAISFKECWQDDKGAWLTDGGFPRQMAGISSLFDEMDLLVVGVAPKSGGYPLPAKANIVPLRQPYGQDTRRKLSVVLNLHYYAGTLLKHILRSDVVHVPLPGDIPLLGLVLALASRKRVLARYGGSWQATSQTTLMNRVTRACMRRFAGCANVMLATGSGSAGPAPGMQWIFSTALTEEEIQSIRPNLERGLRTPPTIVFAGRLSPEKGIGNLIDALALLARSGFAPLPQVRLIGDGPARAALEQQVQTNALSKSIQFLGQLDRGRLSEEFLTADFCVQPSLTEGYSKAWLDAMAHGLPVITSEVGAARSVIGGQGERGWLLRPGDPEALSQMIRHVIESELDWPALRTRCRRHAESLTVECWQREIGTICSRAWNLTLADGRLVG